MQNALRFLMKNISFSSLINIFKIRIKSYLSKRKNLYFSSEIWGRFAFTFCMYFHQNLQVLPSESSACCCHLEQSQLFFSINVVSAKPRSSSIIEPMGLEDISVLIKYKHCILDIVNQTTFWHVSTQNRANLLSGLCHYFNIYLSTTCLLIW